MTPQQQRAKKVLKKIIIPALEAIDKNGAAEQELVLGTGIVESALVRRYQENGGQERGLFQMGPVTFKDTWNYVICYNSPSLYKNVCALAGTTTPTVELLANNDWFATAMCMAHYMRVAEPLPAAGNTYGQAFFWKRYYVSYKGIRAVEKYMLRWESYTGKGNHSEKELK